MKRPMPTYFKRIWFLPSLDELEQMYLNLHLEGVGGFLNYPYWSSSEYIGESQYAWRRYFADGSEYGADKTELYCVRACCSFIAGAGAYSLRDTGPAGGLIFYIDGGTTFYEAAPSDQSTSQVWSNIDDVEIGASAQGTAIGTGQGNTTAIIAQAGHTDSAAKLCDDLII